MSHESCLTYQCLPHKLHRELSHIHMPQEIESNTQRIESITQRIESITHVAEN